MHNGIDFNQRRETIFKSLYCQRKLLNGKEFRHWAEQNGFNNILSSDDFHCTVAFSRQEVNWNMLERQNNNITVNGGVRTVNNLGDQGAIVLFFEPVVFPNRWKYFMDNGCSWDYPEYHPHVSVCYQDFDTDPKTIVPYSGRLIFGPELFSEVNDDWAEKYKDSE